MISLLANKIVTYESTGSSLMEKPTKQKRQIPIRPDPIIPLLVGVGVASTRKLSGFCATATLGIKHPI